MFHPSRARHLLRRAAAPRRPRGAGGARATSPPIEVPLSQVDALWTRDAVVFWPEPPAVRVEPAGTGRVGAAGARGAGLHRARPAPRRSSASSRRWTSCPTACSGPARGWPSSRARGGPGPACPRAERDREPHPRRAPEARAGEGRRASPACSWSARSRGATRDAIPAAAPGWRLGRGRPRGARWPSPCAGSAAAGRPRPAGAGHAPARRPRPRPGGAATRHRPAPAGHVRAHAPAGPATVRPLGPGHRPGRATGPGRRPSTDAIRRPPRRPESRARPTGSG